MVFFSDADSPQALVQLAMVLEEGSRRFYTDLTANLTDPPVSKLFQELASAEERHKEKLRAFQQRIGDDASALPIPDKGLPDLMEGGIPVEQGLQWAAGKSPSEVLQFSMALETNAYDLYLKMIQRMGKDPEAVSLFKHLAEEERLHLQRMGQLLEERL